MHLVLFTVGARHRSEGTGECAGRRRHQWTATTALHADYVQRGGSAGKQVAGTMAWEVVRL